MRIFLLVFVMLMTGCATAPVVVERPPFIDAPFAFNGRILVQQGTSRDGTNIHWVHRGYDEITLLGPLGYTVGRIYRDDRGATLEDAYGKRYTAMDAESLMQRAVGWQLPLTGLRYWLVAAPAPESQFKLERSPNGQVALLTQDGWEISYPRYATSKANALPMELKMVRDGLEVVLVVNEWEIQ